MNLSPALGVIGSLYPVFMTVLAVLAVYVMILIMVFLRLKIAELKRAVRARQAGDS